MVRGSRPEVIRQLSQREGGLVTSVSADVFTATFFAVFDTLGGRRCGLRRQPSNVQSRVVFGIRGCTAEKLDQWMECRRDFEQGNSKYQESRLDAQTALAPKSHAAFSGQRQHSTLVLTAGSRPDMSCNTSVVLLTDLVAKARTQ